MLHILGAPQSSIFCDENRGEVYFNTVFWQINTTNCDWKSVGSCQSFPDSHSARVKSWFLQLRLRLTKRASKQLKDDICYTYICDDFPQRASGAEECLERFSHTVKSFMAPFVLGLITHFCSHARILNKHGGLIKWPTWPVPVAPFNCVHNHADSQYLGQFGRWSAFSPTFTCSSQLSHSYQLKRAEEFWRLKPIEQV